MSDPRRPLARRERPHRRGELAPRRPSRFRRSRPSGPRPDARLLEPEVGENRLEDEVAVGERAEREAESPSIARDAGAALRGGFHRLRFDRGHRSGSLLLRVLEPAEGLLDPRPREVAGGDVHVESDRLYPQCRAARGRESLFVKDERGRDYVHRFFAARTSKRSTMTNPAGVGTSKFVAASVPSAVNPPRFSGGTCARKLPSIPPPSTPAPQRVSRGSPLRSDPRTGRRTPPPAAEKPWTRWSLRPQP